jgi:hypothetical protein
MSLGPEALECVCVPRRLEARRQPRSKAIQKIMTLERGTVPGITPPLNQGKGPGALSIPGPPTSVVAPQEVGLLQGSDATD